MDRPEINVLFEHTSRLRAGKLLLEPAISPRRRVKSRYDNTSPRYKWYRKGDNWSKTGLLIPNDENGEGSEPGFSSADSDVPWYKRRHWEHDNLTQTSKKTSNGKQNTRFQAIDRQEVLDFSSRPAPVEKRFGTAKSPSRLGSIPAPPKLLKRVAHATYGDILKENRANPPRLIAVPRPDGSDEEALFYLQWVLQCPHGAILADQSRHFHQDSMDFEDFKVFLQGQGLAIVTDGI